MHQPITDEPKSTKTIVMLTSVIESATRITGGTGTFSDMMMITASLKFCEDKYSKNSRLGFWDDLVLVRFHLGGIALKACPTKNATIDNWTCPFVSLLEISHIAKLIFLIEYQFMDTPILDPEITLAKQYNNAFVEGQTRL